MQEIIPALFRAAANRPPPAASPYPAPIRVLLSSIDALAPGSLNQALAIVRPHVKMDCLTPAMLLWMLVDDTYGVIHLTKRDDVQHALMLAADVLSLQAGGLMVPNGQHSCAELHAEMAQGSAWRAYKYRRAPPGVARVEWMVASVILRSIDRFGVSTSEAFHSAMVAWGTVIPGRRELTAYEFAQATLTGLLSLARAASNATEAVA